MPKTQHGFRVHEHLTYRNRIIIVPLHSAMHGLPEILPLAIRIVGCSSKAAVNGVIVGDMLMFFLHKLTPPTIREW